MAGWSKLPDYQIYQLVTPSGFEPLTCPLGGGCSIQLSHGATMPLHAIKLGFVQPGFAKKRDMQKEE
jgi:hypothetical protein